LSHNIRVSSGCSFISVCLKYIKLRLYASHFFLNLFLLIPEREVDTKINFPRTERSRERNNTQVYGIEWQRKTCAVFTCPPVRGSTVHKCNHVIEKLTSDNNHAVFFYVDFFPVSFFYILLYPSGLLFPCSPSLFNNIYRSSRLFQSLSNSHYVYSSETFCYGSLYWFIPSFPCSYYQLNPLVFFSFCIFYRVLMDVR
jgi:hypothetical protein